MKRRHVSLLWVALSLAGCDEPCKPGYVRHGRKCEWYPVPDGGSPDASGTGAPGRDGEAGSDLEMDGGGQPACTGAECDPCDPNPCLNAGACEADGKGYSCTCPVGLSGLECQIDPCDLDPCLHDGVCTRTAEGRTCSCVSPWEGTGCERNTDARILTIVPSAGTLFPAFSPSTVAYSLDLGIGDPEVAFTLEAAQPDGVMLAVGDEMVASGVASSPLPLTLNAKPSQQVVIRSLADDGSERSYVITVRRTLSQQAYVKSYRSAPGMTLGGDDPGAPHGQMLSLRGNTLAISDSHFSEDRGVVHLLSRTGAVWGFARSFEEDTPAARLGSAVLVTDSHVVIGAPGKGEVRVYDRSALIEVSPAYDAVRRPAASPAVALFGNALAMAGDTLFVGAPGSGETVPEALLPWGGEVHVFERDGEAWLEAGDPVARRPKCEQVWSADCR